VLRSASVALLLLGGCTHYSQQCYLSIKTNSDPGQIEPAQYYRFDLSGYSYCQRTEFQSGWYDRNAVDILFSEVVTEASKRNVATGGAVAPTIATKPLPDAKKTDAEPEYSVFGPEGKRENAQGKRFVIIASGNPKAIADEIQTVADSNELATTLTLAAQREQRKEALDAHSTLQVKQGAQKAFTTEAKGVLEHLERLDPKTLTPPELLREIERLLKVMPDKR
jgi:hypothetical protein